MATFSEFLKTVGTPEEPAPEEMTPTERQVAEALAAYGPPEEQQDPELGQLEAPPEIELGEVEEPVDPELGEIDADRGPEIGEIEPEREPELGEVEPDAPLEIVPLEEDPEPILPEVEDLPSALGLLNDWPKQPHPEEVPEIPDELFDETMKLIGDGAEVEARGDGATVLVPQAVPWQPQVAPDDGGFRAKITGNAEADSPAQNRWHYAWEEVYRSAAGYDGWSTLSAGRSGTTTSDYALNFAEDMNTAADAASPTVQCNGVDIDGTDFPDGFSVQPCPAGLLVRMYVVPFAVAGITYTEYWFEAPGLNGIDGTCDAP